MSHNTILIINGPNLNMLGTREPDKYGAETLDMIKETLMGMCRKHEVRLDFFQSNSEEKIILKIQDSIGKISGLIINPAAFTHTSIAIRDSLLMLDIPMIEVHLSNIYKRERFRHHSYFSDIVTGQITGCGSAGYEFALDKVIRMINNNAND